MLGGIESLLSAVVADGMTGTRHNSNRELFGQGIANIVTPFFGGVPATGAIARTATNIRSGAVSPISGVIQGIFVLVVLLLFAPFASHIPLASMAPILMVVAYNMSEYRSFWHIVKLKTGDSLVLVTTFILTVTVNLTIAVPIGLLLAMVSFIKRISSVIEIDLIKPDQFNDEKDTQICPQIASFTVRGPLFFGVATRFEQILTRSLQEKPSILLLKMRHVSMIDITGENNLAELVKDFHKRNGLVIITELADEPLEMLKRTGLYDTIGHNNFFEHTTDAINYALEKVSYTSCARCGKSDIPACEVFKKVDKKETRVLETS